MQQQNLSINPWHLLREQGNAQNPALNSLYN